VTVGNHTLTATAYDFAGNSRVETRTYTVMAWEVYGFYSLVDMGGVWNTVKGGSTVPLKFEVFAGSLELTDVSVVQSLTSYQVSCVIFSGIEDPIEAIATGGTLLRYDWDSGQFIFNWKTPKAPGKCYAATMTTASGSYLTAYFKLK
jgi:hypothetical protein